MNGLSVNICPTLSLGMKDPWKLEVKINVLSAGNIVIYNWSIACPDLKFPSLIVTSPSKQTPSWATLHSNNRVYPSSIFPAAGLHIVLATYFTHKQNITQTSTQFTFYISLIDSFNFKAQTTLLYWAARRLAEKWGLTRLKVTVKVRGCNDFASTIFYMLLLVFICLF